MIKLDSKKRTMFALVLISQILSTPCLTKDASEFGHKSTKVQQATERYKHDVLFDLLSKDELRGDSLNNEQSDKNLSLLCGDISYTSTDMASNIKQHLVTTAGEAEMAFMLENPTEDANIIRNKRSIIRELVLNTELFEQLNIHLNQIKDAESGFCVSWLDQDEISKAIIQNLYFGNDKTKIGKLLSKLNESEAILEFTHRAPLICFSASTSSSLEYIYETAKIIFITKNILDISAKGNFVVMKSMPYSIKWLFLSGCSVLLNSLFDYLSYNVFKNNKDVLNKVQSNMISVAETTRSMAAIYKLTLDSNLADWLQSLDELGNFLYISKKENKDLHYLVNSLQSNTFTDEASYFSCIGKVLLTNKKMQELKDEFIRPLQVIGELDVCLAIAKFYKEQAIESYNVDKAIDRLLPSWQ